MSPIIYTPHQCETPPADVPVGSLWQCPDCDKAWGLDTHVRETGPTRVWRAVADPRRAAALRDVNPMRGEQEAPAPSPALQEVLAAWTVPGRRPGYHDRMRSTVRAAMPNLGRALDAAAYPQPGQDRA